MGLKIITRGRCGTRRAADWARTRLPEVPLTTIYFMITAGVAFQQRGPGYRLFGQDVLAPDAVDAKLVDRPPALTAGPVPFRIDRGCSTATASCAV